VIQVESKLKVSDNAGGILFTAITIKHGFKRRYAYLGELIGVVSRTRKVYNRETDDKLKLAKLAKKVKKKRKIKSKKRKQPNTRPYLGLLINTKYPTNRINGSYIKFDENRMITFTEPTKYGPAGKTDKNIPNLVGTKITSPAIMELVENKTIKERFKKVIDLSGGIV